MPRPLKNDAQNHGLRRKGTPQKPPRLGDHQAEQWDRISKELTDSGVVLTTAHASLLAIAASLAVDIESCNQALRENGSDYTQAGTGAAKLHPAAARLDYLRRDLSKILVVLGAAKPGADEAPTGKKDPIADLLGRK